MSNIKLNFIHICDYASLADGEKLNVMGIFKNIFGFQLPIIHLQMFIVSNITVSEIREYIQTLRLVNSSGVDIISPIKLSSSVINENNKDIGLLIQLNSVKFEKEGEYRFILDVNGEKVGEVPLLVSLKK